jgi:serine/threonine protein kinase
MELYCTRPSCPKPQNVFPRLNDHETLRTVKQQFCMSCGMPLILEGRYLTTKILGEGGFGTAYLGRDRLTPRMRQCAIKQFKPAMVMTPQQLTMARDLFHREAEILEQLGSEHPQIPHLFAFFDLPSPNLATGIDDRFFYLVQEFVEGENLEQEMLRRGCFSEADIIKIMTEMLNILDFIHSHNVIHRDIKPSNIMRHTNGRLYLLDFGAIKNIAKPGSTVIYSPGYAPPEQLRGQQVFFASDLYALAATCVVLLTNETNENLFDTVRDRWQWENYAQVSEHTTAVLNKMLQNAPFDRFQSVAETREALTAKQAISLPTIIPPDPTFNPASANLPTAISGGVYGIAPDPVVVIPTPQVFTSGTIPLTKTNRHLPLHQLPLPEYVGRASFVGWHSSLIGVISDQLSLPTPILVLLGAVALVYLQWQRLLNKITMVGIAAFSGVIVLVVAKPDLVLFTATMLGGVIATIATAILFRLVYRLLSGLS